VKLRLRCRERRHQLSEYAIQKRPREAAGGFP
jgi:hypothetical protein